MVVMKDNNKMIGVVIIVILLIQSILFFSPISAAIEEPQYKFELENRTDILPYPYSRGSAVWVDEQESIYIFSGRNETAKLDRIMKYTPRTDQITILQTKLPTELMGTTAVYDGSHVYIFGGWGYEEFNDTILQFDPKTEKVSTMNAHLPKPTVGAAAVWTGEYIYFTGGSWGGNKTEGPGKFDTILRYDTAKDEITVMNSTLPYGRSGLAAAWDGEFMYLVGGSDGKNYSAKVFKYEPETDTLTLLDGRLPSGRKHTQVEVHNGSLYIFGGRGGPTVLYDEIIRYDLRTDNVQILDQKLPTSSEFRMHAYDGENIYIIGGFSGPKDFNQFIKFTPDSEPTKLSCAICPISPEVEVLVIIVLILAAVITLTLINDHRSKRKKQA